MLYLTSVHLEKIEFYKKKGAGVDFGKLGNSNRTPPLANNETSDSRYGSLNSVSIT